MRKNQKTNKKLVKKYLNFAFFVERQEIYSNTSNNSRRKKGKKLIIPVDIIRGNTVFETF